MTFANDTSARPTGVAVQSAPVTLEKGRNISEKSIARIVGVPYEQDPEAYRREAPANLVAFAENVA